MRVDPGMVRPLSEQMDRSWRLCATAFSFTLFGMGAIVLWVLLFPVVSAFLGQGPGRKRRARRFMHLVFRLFVSVMRGLGLMDFTVKNADRLNRPGRLVVSNHPSLIDIVLLISMVRNATCIVKPALARNPFMRPPIRAMHYLYAEDTETLLERCAEDLQEGSSLIVFPEGTRTPPGETRLFHRGAANIALRFGVPILPVYIHCQPAWLTKQLPWHYVPPRPARYHFHVGEEIDPTPYGGDRPLAARKLTHALQDYFIEQARNHG